MLLLFFYAQLPVGQQKNGFPPLRPKKTIKSALKKLHNLPHNRPFLPHPIRSPDSNKEPDHFQVVFWQSGWLP